MEFIYLASYCDGACRCISECLFFAKEQRAAKKNHRRAGKRRAKNIAGVGRRESLAEIPIKPKSANKYLKIDTHSHVANYLEYLRN